MIWLFDQFCKVHILNCHNQELKNNKTFYESNYIRIYILYKINKIGKYSYKHSLMKFMHLWDLDPQDNRIQSLILYNVRELNIELNLFFMNLIFSINHNNLFNDKFGIIILNIYCKFLMHFYHREILLSCICN